MNVPPLPRTPGGTRRFFDAYTQGLTPAEIKRLFMRDAPEAYGFFLRAVDLSELKTLPWHRRAIARARIFFLAFTLKLSPGRRAIYAVALAAAIIGLIELAFANGTMLLLAAFLLVNLLFLLEVADRLSLKNDLEIARQIQQAMLPTATYQAPGIEAFGMTRPANTVGGDFYDILPLPDGRVLLALGDVAGKGSPAALLMALLLAMMRTLVDEGFDGAALVTRLNAQIAKHAPASRFITLFVGTLNTTTGELVYVNAGQNPPLLRRSAGRYERLKDGGVALGMFDHASYVTGHTQLATGDLLVLFSDGVTEAEDLAGNPFDECGLEAVVESRGWGSARELGWATFAAVERHANEKRLIDDLTVLVARKLPPLPAGAVAETAAVGV